MDLTEDDALRLEDNELDMGSNHSDTNKDEDSGLSPISSDENDDLRAEEGYKRPSEKEPDLDRDEPGRQSPLDDDHDAVTLPVDVNNAIISDDDDGVLDKDTEIGTLLRDDEDILLDEDQTNSTSLPPDLDEEANSNSNPAGEAVLVMPNIDALLRDEDDDNESQLNPLMNDEEGEDVKEAIEDADSKDVNPVMVNEDSEDKNKDSNQDDAEDTEGNPLVNSSVMDIDVDNSDLTENKSKESNPNSPLHADKILIEEDSKGSTEAAEKDPTDLVTTQTENKEDKDQENESNKDKPHPTLETDEVMLDESPSAPTAKETDEGADLVVDKEKSGDGEDEKEKSDDDEDMPMIRMSSNIFEANDGEDEEDDDDEMDPSFIASMMHVEMGEETEEGGNKSTPKKQRRSADDMLLAEEALPVRRTPKRAAAQAAANTIKEITSLEQEFGAPSEESDPAYRAGVVRRNSSSASGTTNKSGSDSVAEGDRQRCHQCKNVVQSLIVVRQYGTDIHLCSNTCFNAFRNPDPMFRPLPCAKCGNLNRDYENGRLFFWETMNFCSDICVGNYQLQIGSTCSTCSKKTPWGSMGKYCVRFGSDVRQFCTGSCLESYKKSARVCFHCQLDIKRLGNVVLANIPSKATTKEFCSQDCVEMYIEQNVKTTPPTHKPPGTAICATCKSSKVVFRELVTSTSSYKTCSQACWTKVLESQDVSSPTKCETCAKYINMDNISISPSFYVSTEKRAHGFCSATCKNVFVLKSRQILSCTKCQVKKYNYDLIQHVTGRVTNYAVCSLNCLPQPSQYVLNLKDKIQPPLPISSVKKTYSSSRSGPTITSVVGNSNKTQMTNGDAVVNGFNSGTLVNGEAGYDYSTVPVADVTVRQMGDDDIIEIRDDDVIPLEDGQTQIVPQYNNEEEVSWDDHRLVECGMVLITRKPEPVERRNKACQVRPIRRTREVEVQTDSEELWEMPRVEMKIPEPEEKVHYVPVPIPYPVLIPFPCYAMDRPIPVPFPVGIPVPIPIPVDLTNFMNGGLTFNDIPRIEVRRSTSDGDDVEMMDTSESCEPDPTTSPYLNLFNFSNSPMSVGSPTASCPASGPSSVTPGSPVGGKGRLSRADQGIRAWKLNFPDDKDPLTSPPEEFSEKLVTFVQRATKPKGDRCRIEPDLLFNYVLGIQQYLKNGGRTDSFFYDSVYSPFVKAMTAYAEEEASRGRTIARVDEEHVWDSLELGVGSPGILLFTLIYHIYKHFHLKTWQEHAALEFSQIHVEEKTSENGETKKYISIDGITNVDNELIEVGELTDNTLRCPIKLYEFYKSKCSTTEGTFYKSIESNPTEGSSWYTAESLNQFDLYHMLVRAMMIHFDDSTE